jgi:pilus assembly protein CpaE
MIAESGVVEANFESASNLVFASPTPAMFTATVLAADDARLHQLQALLLTSGKATPFRSYSRYPSTIEIARLLGSIKLDLVLLDLEDRDIAINLARQIHEGSPRTAIIGFGGLDNERAGVAGSGIIRIIPGVPTLDLLKDAIRAAIHAVQGTLVGNLVALLPGKAGVGCSTIVLNAAMAIAGSLSKRVLVMDADLRSGVLSVLLDRVPTACVQHFLERTEELDVFGWSRLITKIHGVDFLFSGCKAARRLPHWDDYFGLLEFVKSRYDVILVDLPEVVDDASAEFVRRAKYVFLVCSQEIPSVHLARLRLQELIAWGVSSERLRVLVNRWQKHELPVSDIERLLGQPVLSRFPNDNQCLRHSVLKGQAVTPASKLGRSYLDFAHAVLADSTARHRTALSSFSALLKSFKWRRIHGDTHQALGTEI